MIYIFVDLQIALKIKQFYYETIHFLIFIIKTMGSNPTQ